MGPSKKSISYNTMVPSSESILWATELINNMTPSTYNLTLNKGRDRFISVNAMSLDNGGGWEKNASFSLFCEKKNILYHLLQNSQ